MNNPKISHQILIVGGGTAGITVASQLRRADQTLDIAIIEPSEQHYYQPAWTLVGGGLYQIEDTRKPEKECIPNGVTWIQAAVETFEPDDNYVMTKKGQRIDYDYLIVCPGIQIDWHLIKGLPEALGKEGVTSNYSRQCAPYTWDVIRNFKGGNAIFTFPATPIKCAGAPQKIMYLADEAFRQRGVREQTNMIYGVATGKLFGVPAYCDSLEKIVKRKNIDVKFQHNLIEIKPDTKEAIFAAQTPQGVEEVTLKYDMIHVAPPMSAPDFIKKSKLAATEGAAKGWVDVDKHTLQHHVYPNVFSLGDASSLPTSKTAAAVRRQAPAVVNNILALIKSQTLQGSYQGYTCCPLITGYGKTIMAEFDYEKVPKSSFPLDSTQERFTMWLVKRYLLPWVYWNRMLKGAPFETEQLQSLQFWRR